MLALAHANEAGTLPDRYELSAMLYQLLMSVLSALGQVQTTAQPRVARAIEIIAARASDPRFDVRTLCGAVGCSREYMARAFRRALATSPSDYLLQQRMRLVARELRITADKLDLIARRCGFGSANYLCRVFRKQAGITPDQFRRERWRAIS